MAREHKQSGFTLIELMITLVIATILLTQAVPSFQAMIANNRITAQVNEIVTSIQYARNEAAKRTSTIVMCYSADPGAAAPVCGGTAGSSPRGWLIFASADGSTTFDSTDTNYTLLRVDIIESTQTGVNFNATVNNGLSINADGSTSEGGNTAVFAVCDDRGENYGKQLQVLPSGHVQLVSSPIPDCNTPTAS